MKDTTSWYLIGAVVVIVLSIIWFFVIDRTVENQPEPLPEMPATEEVIQE